MILKRANSRPRTLVCGRVGNRDRHAAVSGRPVLTSRLAFNRSSRESLRAAE
jgi:hypothetical protein